MEFKARERYKDQEVVKQYDQLRFSSLKGRVTDWLEKSAINKAIMTAGIPPGAIILDIPCGTGRLSVFLAARKYRIVASDISISMLQLSRNKIMSMNINHQVAYIAIDAAKLPFSTAVFDTVVSLRLFGHVPPLIRTNIVKEFAQVSKGYIVIAYYHKHCLQNILRKRNRTRAQIPWYPVTYAEIKHELEIAGLDKIKIYPMLFGISETIVVLAKKRTK